MMGDLKYYTNKAELEQIVFHLLLCDQLFTPPLSSRVSIEEYAKKIELNALRFEAWDCDQLVGLVAIYMNDEKKSEAFITNVSVLDEYRGRGVATQLLTQGI